jgi:tetratricopeptide (TPR) repeat protein
LTQSKRFSQTVITVVIVVAVLGLGLIQIASDGLSSSIASPGSLPSHVSGGFGLRVYEWLDRIAPAPYVESNLARSALARGDAAAAEHYAVRLPASPTRNELLAQVARAQGLPALAFEYFFAAPDVDEVQREIFARSSTDPRNAYDDEVRFRDRLIVLTTHPDAVADAYWLGGKIAVRVVWTQRYPHDYWQQRALVDFLTAVKLAPLNMKYVLAAANQALVMQDISDARRLYRHGVEIDPANADALAGLGIVSLRGGDRADAQRYAARAYAIDASSGLVRELERELH